MTIEKLDAARSALEQHAGHFGAALQVLEHAETVLRDAFKDLKLRIEDHDGVTKALDGLHSAHEALIPVGALAPGSPSTYGALALANEGTGAQQTTALSPSGEPVAVDGNPAPAATVPAPPAASAPAAASNPDPAPGEAGDVNPKTPANK